MINNAPIALPRPPRFHESSSLRSPRDSDNTARIWKRAKIINQALASTQNGTAQNGRAIDKLRRRILGGSSPAQSVGIQGFQIQSDGGDYWICYTWDGTTLGASNWYIIKPFKIRCGTTGLTGQTIRGTAYAYTYTPVYISGSSGPVSYYTRTVKVAGTTIETNYVIPDPILNDVIYASTCTTAILPSSAMVPSNPTGGQLLDINADGRFWGQ